MAGKLSTVWTKAERAAWQLPAKLTVSEWADRYRVVGNYGVEPGPWRTLRTPYLRGPMDAFCDPEVREITLMFPAQFGKTECVHNMLGYVVDQDPSPSVLMVPRDEDRYKVAKRRLRPLFEDSPKLAEHLTDRIWDLAQTEFVFDRMVLDFVASNSAAGLAGWPRRYIFIDEPDKFPPFVGREAAPVDLISERAENFWDAKIVKVCTPTTADGVINLAFEDSNKQRYYIPCPHCGQWSWWKFQQLKVPKTLRDPGEILKGKDVWYECESCVYKIREYLKDQLVAQGEWVPEGCKVSPEGKISGRPRRDKYHSGYQASRLISAFSTWPKIMASWFRANQPEKIRKGALMNFKNSTLAEPFEETVTEMSVIKLHKQLGQFSRGTVPAEGLLLVAGADYHEDARGTVRIDYQVQAFGYAEKNWTISSGSVPNFEQLDEEVLRAPFPWSDGTPNEKKPYLAVNLMFVDSGFKADKVYKYCLQRPGLTIPTKGASGKMRAPLIVSKLERSSQLGQYYHGLRLYIIDTEFFKDKIASWLQDIRDEAGNVIAEPLTQFYAEVPDYYLKELTNEHKVAVKSKKKGTVTHEWRPVTEGASTHSLDTFVLCAAAAYHRGVHYLVPPSQRTAKTRPSAAQSAKFKPKRIRKGGFLDDLPEL